MGVSGGLLIERAVTTQWPPAESGAITSKVTSGGRSYLPGNRLHEIVAVDYGSGIGRKPHEPFLDGELGRPAGFAKVEEGLVAFECEPGEQHYNTIGVAHGGLAMTLLDSAMGCCVHTRLPLKKGYTTLEVQVNLVRAITGQTGTIRGTTTCIILG